MSWTLDRICALVTSAAALNALHACREGHPWNKTTRNPWTNAAFVLGGRPSWEIDSTAIDWLRAQARAHGEI